MISLAGKDIGFLPSINIANRQQKPSEISGVLSQSKANKRPTLAMSSLNIQLSYTLLYCDTVITLP